jgi:hypothetical protein
MTYNLGDQFRLCIESQNEQAKKHRAMLTHLIRVVYVFGKLGLTFSGHEISTLPPTVEIPGGGEVADK